MWESLKARFIANFLYKNQWKYIADGLGITLKVTLFAGLLGVAIGFFVAMVRSTHDKTGKLRILNWVCNLYLTIIRGTPVVVQLLIIYFVVFGSVKIDKVLVAIMAFGINSGAYVAEIIRGGIMSIDGGQMEAGRSLGFGYVATMRYIILPQAFKAVLPTLANEFIVLLKETAVAGYVGLTDVTYAGNIIGGNCYDYLFPLLMSALIYLILVMFFTFLVGKLERRLRSSER